MKTITVNLTKDRTFSYDICIGHDVLDRIGFIIAKSLTAADPCAIITDSCVSRLYGGAFREKLREMGLNVDLIEFPAGEASKTMETVLAVTERLLAMGADRSATLIALGGGVVGDVTGFVASLYMRSLSYMQIPTTLMAQVDSSIGGKTGVNLPQGKNLVGTFYQPKGVFVDLKFLETLPREEFDSGMAEIIKYGIIDGENLFQTMERNIDAMRRRDTEFLFHLVENCCRIKKEIVEVDEREQGLRRILNFGHTIGHALEAESGYAVSHGNAVAIGMIAMARISERSYDFPQDDRTRIESLLGEVGLPCHIPANIDAKRILTRLRVDKKKKGGAVHFVLLKKMGMPFVSEGVAEELLIETLEGLKT